MNDLKQNRKFYAGFMLVLNHYWWCNLGITSDNRLSKKVLLTVRYKVLYSSGQTHSIRRWKTTTRGWDKKSKRKRRENKGGIRTKAGKYCYNTGTVIR